MTRRNCQTASFVPDSTHELTRPAHCRRKVRYIYFWQDNKQSYCFYSTVSSLRLLLSSLSTLADCSIRQRTTSPTRGEGIHRYKPTRHIPNQRPKSQQFPIFIVFVITFRTHLWMLLKLITIPEHLIFLLFKSRYYLFVS